MTWIFIDVFVRAPHKYCLTLSLDMNMNKDAMRGPEMMGILFAGCVTNLLLNRLLRKQTRLITVHIFHKNIRRFDLDFSFFGKLL